MKSENPPSSKLLSSIKVEKEEGEDEYGRSKERDGQRGRSEEEELETGWGRGGG